LDVPSGLRWWRSQPAGAEWLARLPRLVAECAELWALEVGTAYAGSHVSLVAPATRADGRIAVLKVNFPDPESEHEPDALSHWDGRGAVRLLESDRERSALLVERCRPGTGLWDVQDEDEANRIAAGVLRGLWRPPPPEHPFRALAEEAASWAVELPVLWEQLGRPFERRLVDEAVAFTRELGSSQGEPVVLHQDYHGGNVLRAEREPWLAIDPKPLVGEREFDAASLLRDRRDELVADPRPQRRVRRRLDLLAAELALDRERMRGWGIVHALAWGVSGIGKVEEEMVGCARWLAAS
jgi:streptomycin 6-kinase